MRLIEDLSEMIEEELSDAEKYIKCAAAKKEDYPVLAETFYKLSTEEMQHMAMLHDQVVKIIEDYKKTKGEPPADMMVLYNYLHKKHAEKALEIKNMQMAYKSTPMK